MRAFLALCVLPALAVAQLTSVYSDADLSGAAQAATSLLTTDGASIAPADAYFASVVLSQAKSPKSKPAAACASLASTLSSSASLSIGDLSYGLRAAYNLGCLQKTQVDDSVVSSLQKGLESSSLADLFHAVSALPVASNKGAKIDVSWKELVAVVAKLLESDGHFRDSAKSPASALSAAHAYHILAAAYPSVKSSKQDAEKIKTVTESIGSLLQSAAGSEDTSLDLGDGEEKLLTTALAVSGALKLADVTGVDVDAQGEQLAAFGAFFLQHRHVQDAAIAGQLITGLRALASNPVVVPLAVTLETSTLAHGSADPVVVSVTNVFGAFATDADVILDSAMRVGAKKAVLKETHLKPASSSSDTNTQYLLELGAIDAGIYSLELAVQPASTQFGEIEATTRLVTITTSLELGDATILVTKVGGTSDTVTASHPNAASRVLSAGTDSHLTVTFTTTSKSGAAFLPHQAFVELQHEETGVATVFVASGSSSDGSHRVSLDISSRKALFEAVEPGRYSVSLFIGDSTIDNSVQWKIGSVDLAPPAAPPAPEEILYSKPLMHDSDVTLKALPTITHQFREPEKRPALIVSQLFTIFALLPLAFLIIGLLRTGANSERLGQGGVWGPGYLLSLLAVLGLIFVYWLKLNMFVLLSLMAIPSVLAILFGNSLFRSLHEAETQEKKKKN